jgi:triacylglycerol esterase/lipase EstA (alpha/beta hydrolase family)
VRAMRTLATVVLAIGILAAPAAGATYYTSGVSPVGSNDWSCKPTAAHPEPVVLVHGTFADMTVSWNLFSPALHNDGYCVFALDYGNRATNDIAQSANELSAFVDRVLSATGASKVDIVGHSQGGMMPRYYIKNLGGDAKVDDLVGLAPSNHGTTNRAAFYANSQTCQACVQQQAGSPFLASLNAGDESPGAVSYTQVETVYDEVVTPYTSAFLAPDTDVTNVTLQDKCPNDVSEHLGISHDPIALQWAENALGRAGSADPAFAPNCAG